MKRVIVIGAGPAGLAAAYRLQQKGFRDITVLEGSDQVGGLAKSLKRKNCIVDMGPHQVHTKDQTIIDFLQEILQKDFTTNTKKASHFYLGKFYNYPLQIKDVLLGLPWHVSIGCFLGFLKQTLKNVLQKNSSQKDSFESWVIRHFGEKMYRVYFGPYTQKVWGKPPHLLHSICAKERIAVQNLWDVVLSAISRKIVNFRNHYHLPHSPYQSTFYYPRYGYGQISERMAQDLQDNGGRVCFKERVSQVNWSNLGYVVKTEQGSAYWADIVISTMPIHLLKEALPDTQNDKKKPVEQLEFRSLTFLYFVLNREKVTDNHWIYFPDEDTLFQRSCEFRNFNASLAPQGKSVVCLEIPCDYQDHIWNMSKEDLVKLVLPKATEQYLKEEWIEESFLARERYAYPTYSIDYDTNLAIIQDYLKEFPGLYSIGRSGAFKYINIDQVIAMGFKTAEEIASHQKSVEKAECLSPAYSS